MGHLRIIWLSWGEEQWLTMNRPWDAGLLDVTTDAPFMRQQLCWIYLSQWRHFRSSYRVFHLKSLLIGLSIIYEISDLLEYVFIVNFNREIHLCSRHHFRPFHRLAILSDIGNRSGNWNHENNASLQNRLGKLKPQSGQKEHSKKS